MLDIAYTLSDKSISAVELSKWVRARMPKFSIPDSLTIARLLIKGERWRPPVDEIVNYQDNGPCDYVTTPDLDNHWEVREAEMNSLCALGKRGAEGDAQAATDFCKAFMEGKLNFLGMAFA